MKKNILKLLIVTFISITIFGCGESNNNYEEKDILTTTTTTSNVKEENNPGTEDVTTTSETTTTRATTTTKVTTQKRENTTSTTTKPVTTSVPTTTVVSTTTTTKPTTTTTKPTTTTASCDVNFNGSCYKVGSSVKVNFGIKTSESDVATVGPIVLDILKKDASDSDTANSVDIKYNLVVSDLSLYKVSDASSDPTAGYGSKGVLIRLADEPYTQGLETKPKNYSNGQNLLTYTVTFKQAGTYKYRFNDNIEVRSSENERISYNKIINVK